MKTEKEIQKAEQEFFEKVAYDRHCLIGGPKSAVKKIEEKYGKDNLKPMSDFEWGYLCGKFASMRWVLDNDVDWEDSGLLDT